ncbi:unannotated protein [freshwater metagenome]|uniref:Unannotated protein n=1 Tax=freshwater metagenome TaxID=449393 RepID=A0A6J5ZKV3_9ZZZZ|nr:hypothetical protein [Actinomycetota bacterium]
MKVELVEDGLKATHGLRAPGLGLPGLRKVGSWHGSDGRSFISVDRNQPAVRVSLSPDANWAAVMIGSADAAAVARSIEAG